MRVEERISQSINSLFATIEGKNVSRIKVANGINPTDREKVKYFRKRALSNTVTKGQKTYAKKRLKELGGI